jgi:uncharacterized protein (DUF362 family)
MRTSASVAHGNGPYANTRKALQSIDLAVFCGKRVLLKPNVGRVAQPGAGVTTHPDVIAAAIDALRDAGADVAVGESPIVGVRVREAFEVSGIASIARERGCPLLEMDRRRFVEVAVPQGRVLRALRVCRDVLEADAVVSVPVMKTHMHTGVTLAVKNMKGCLWRRSKVELHMLPPVEGSEEKPIDVAIADMSSVLRPHLAIIDGTVGMEGLGPSAGQPKPFDVVVVSTDPYSGDAIACRLMGTKAEHIPHLRIGAERGYGNIDSRTITVAPENWRDCISPFCRPPENLSIQFPNIKVLDNRSCSACQSTLFLFLNRYRARLFDYFPSSRPITVAIGKGHTKLPDGTLCVGNCTADHQSAGVFIPGCPPVGSQILTAVSGKPSTDTLDGQGKASDKHAAASQEMPSGRPVPR